MITYHQRGQAGSTHSPPPVPFTVHAADAAALLGHLGVRRAHVAGHSTGGAIALQLAADRPELVHTLALLEPLGVQMGAPSVGVFLEKAGPALAAYGSGDREGAMAGFLSVVCGLDWETCRAVIEQRVPGGVAQAVRDADTVFGSYLPALNAWPFGSEQAATSPSRCCRCWARRPSSCSWTATNSSTPGSRRSRTARSRASPTCCTCSVRRPWRRASPRSSPATPSRAGAPGDAAAGEAPRLLQERVRRAPAPRHRTAAWR